MPYKSDAQRGFFHANVGKKGITKKVVEEFDRASKGKKLPERVGKGHNDAHERKEVRLLDEMKAMHADVGKGQSKKVGCGHASCVGKGCSMKTGKGQSKLAGKGRGAVTAPDAMPKRKPRGAQPLPVAKKAVSRRHRPPANRTPPKAMVGAAGPGISGGPPGMGMPATGAAPAMPGVTPGMPPTPRIPGMGQSSKKMRY